MCIEVQGIIDMIGRKATGVTDQPNNSLSDILLTSLVLRLTE